MSDKPSADDQERAKWALLQAQIRQANSQVRWEIPKAAAMMAIALAALIAASRLGDLWIPVRPQTITVNFDQPLTVKLQDSSK